MMPASTDVRDKKLTKNLQKSGMQREHVPTGEPTIKQKFLIRRESTRLKKVTACLGGLETGGSNKGRYSPACGP